MFVVTYDISSPKRLRRVARLMGKYGGRAQKSVFECDISKEQLMQLQKKIKKVIDREKDSVRFYYLCQPCLSKIEWLGVGAVPEEEKHVCVKV
jgi:CRISPR-associated protein Cas2